MLACGEGNFRLASTTELNLSPGQVNMIYVCKPFKKTALKGLGPEIELKFSD